MAYLRSFFRQLGWVVLAVTLSWLTATPLRAADPEGPSPQPSEGLPLRTSYYQRTETKDMDSFVGFLRKNSVVRGIRRRGCAVMFTLSANGHTYSLSGVLTGAPPRGISPGGFEMMVFEKANDTDVAKIKAIYNATSELKSTPDKTRAFDAPTLVRVIVEMEHFAKGMSDPPTHEQQEQEMAIIQAAKSVASDPARIQTLDQAITEAKELAYDLWKLKSISTQYEIPAMAIGVDDDGRIVERENVMPPVIACGGTQYAVLFAERLQTPDVSRQEWERHNEKYTVTPRVAKPGDPDFASRGTERYQFAGKYIDVAIPGEPPFYSFKVLNPCWRCYLVRIKIDDKLTVFGGGQRVRKFTVMAYGEDDQPIMEPDGTALGYFFLDEKGEFSHVEYVSREFAIPRQ